MGEIFQIKGLFSSGAQYSLISKLPVWFYIQMSISFTDLGEIHKTMLNLMKIIGSKILEGS